MRSALCTLSVLLGLIGCDAREGSESRAAPPRVVSGNGVIRGVVKFAGSAPVMNTIQNVPCHPGAGPIQEQTVVANADGTLRNVLVYLDGAPRGD